MKYRYILGSITRISSLEQCGFTVTQLPRNQWDSGDYVVGEIISSSGCLCNVELANGRMAEVADGDKIIGAFGKRAATLAAVGDWEAIADDNQFELMTCAGLFGKITSKSVFTPPHISLSYQGHVIVQGKKSNMADFVIDEEEKPINLPIILIIGTSMSAGKTVAGKIIVRQLKRAGLKVIAAKITGAARYRDMLSVSDAGADYVFDFVDMGLPSTICDPEAFRKSLRQLMSRMTKIGADVLVVEAGASPLEPYNGSVAIEEINEHVVCTVLCASDPYAVIGVASAFNRKPDIVAGGAANTSAAVALVEKLTGIQTMNLMKKESIPELNKLLSVRLNKKI
jgi:hypothetical protein